MPSTNQEKMAKKNAKINKHHDVYINTLKLHARVWQMGYVCIKCVGYRAHAFQRRLRRRRIQYLIPKVQQSQKSLPEVSGHVDDHVQTLGYCLGTGCINGRMEHHIKGVGEASKRTRRSCLHHHT